MDDTEGDSRFPPSYGGHVAANGPKVSVHNAPHHPSQQTAANYVDEDEEEQEIEGDDIRKNSDDDDDDDTDEDHSRSDGVDFQRHLKKRKLKSLLSSFEFTPRVPAPPPPPPAAANLAAKPFSGRRNALTDWTEHETLVLLESWGERFLKGGRKSLRSEEWQEVAENVTRESKTGRTERSCRNRLDTLKKKYKKEKALALGRNTTWVYFKKMDMLMAAPPPEPAAGLSLAVDSGEYVFTDSGEGDDDSGLLPPKRRRTKGETGSFRMLADSINKFSEIYEKIEDGKRKQMVELEKMRMDFQRELELQKRGILNRTREEIAKIRGDYEENDSAENIGG